MRWHLVGRRFVNFGLDPAGLPKAQLSSRVAGYLEIPY